MVRRRERVRHFEHQRLETPVYDPRASSSHAEQRSASWQSSRVTHYTRDQLLERLRPSRTTSAPMRLRLWPCTAHGLLLRVG